MKPFEFIVSAPYRIDSMWSWTDQIRRIETLGFDAVVMADHFTDGYCLEPMVALTAAAMATSTLRLHTGVLGNDYRHPVLTSRMAAALDVISDGRYTLGIGAGWMSSDYAAAGISLDRPGVRVERLDESVQIIQGLLAGGRFRFAGRHYEVDLEMEPATVQQPIPMLIGGGSPRVLGVAGRYAQIVGIAANLAAGELGAHAIEDLAADRVQQKIGWALDAARAAGRDASALTLEMNHWLVRVTASTHERDDLLSKVATRYGVPLEILVDSPSVLVGTVQQVIDQLVERREQFGISCIQLDAGFAPSDIEALAPIVSQLSGA